MMKSPDDSLLPRASMDQTKVLLAAADTLVRAGIRALIDRMECIDVVEEAGETSETLSQIEEKRPDVVLVDVSLPGTNSLELLTRIGSEFPEVRVIILAMHESPEYVLLALRYGAKSCLTGSASQSELELAIRTVAGGTRYVQASSPQNLLALVDETPGKKEIGVDLTARQVEVLRLIAKGHSNKRIALALLISVKTVESHRAQLMERLNIHDVAGLVRYALKHGLVNLN